jgi:hypothetical protein
MDGRSGSGPPESERPGLARPGALENTFNSSAARDNRRHQPAQGAQRDLRFRHDVVRLHARGPRAIYELLAELGARRLCRTEIEQLVGCYAALDPEMIRAVGADRLPPLPVPRLVTEP